jgi:hypothetical protein
VDLVRRENDRPSQGRRSSSRRRRIILRTTGNNMLRQGERQQNSVRARSSSRGRRKGVCVAVNEDSSVRSADPTRTSRLRIRA